MVATPDCALTSSDARESAEEWLAVLTINMAGTQLLRRLSAGAARISWLRV